MDSTGPDMFDIIAAHGNRPGFAEGGWTGRAGDNFLICRDNFAFSVLAGPYTKCKPANSTPKTALDALFVTSDAEGPYSHVECGAFSQRPEPWHIWDIFCITDEYIDDSTFWFVPVAIVRKLIDAHGGIRATADGDPARRVP